MPQIMVEAFARSLIDKIMLEAFDAVDTDDEKLRMLDSPEETFDIQSQSSHTALRTHDRSRADCNESETAELIGKMVRGLRNVQIGDSISVSSPLSKLEKQIKNAVRNIDSVSLTDGSKPVETQITQGQGDVHQIIHDAVIERSADPTCARKEKETSGSNEATKVSISLLHRMIEELETKTEKTDVEKETESESVNREGISAWEETEEQLIRTIENVDDPDQNNVDFPSGSSSRNHVCDFTREGLASSSPVHSTNFTDSVCLEEVAVEEITPSPLPPQKDKSSSNSASGKNRKSSLVDAKFRSRKKKGVLGRIRKLLRTIFGHRKN